MTWKTSEGERVLGPCEAKLFLSFFDYWWDSNERLSAEAKEWINAEEPFESLSTAQQHSVVEEVLVHLLSETKKIPKLSAANESCIYSIFKQYIGNDLETVEDIYGPLILDALEERGCPIKRGKEKKEKAKRKKRSARQREEDEEEEADKDFWPYMGCRDEEKWNDAIEFLADCILWDRDWEMPEVQENPGLMAYMHIDSDYYKKPRAKAGAQQRVDKFLHAKNLEENEAENKERQEMCVCKRALPNKDSICADC